MKINKKYVQFLVVGLLIIVWVYGNAIAVTHLIGGNAVGSYLITYPMGQITPTPTPHTPTPIQPTPTPHTPIPPSPTRTPGFDSLSLMITIFFIYCFVIKNRH